MKFGKLLRRKALHKWSGRYIAYKVLKRVIKELASPSDTSSSVEESISHFADRLDFERRKISEFYGRKGRYVQLRRRVLLQRLQAVVDMSTKAANTGGLVIHAALLSLRQAFDLFYKELEELRAYCLLNHEGFRKITKKLVKRLDGNEIAQQFQREALASLALEPFVQSYKNGGALERVMQELEDKFAAVRRQLGQEDRVIGSLLKSFGRRYPMSSSELHSAAMEPERLLIFAAIENNVGAVRSILPYVSNIDATDDRGRSALCLVAMGGFVEIMNELLTHGAQLDTCDVCIRSPLHLAALRGRAGAVRLLIDKGAAVDAVEQDLRTPLQLAAINGEPDCCSALLEARASLEQQDALGMTALSHACAQGRAQTAALLLQSGASMRIPQWCGQMPMHLAAEGGHTECVKLLVDAGASIAVFDSEGQSPLHSAAAHNRTETLGLLLQLVKAMTVVTSEKGVDTYTIFSRLSAIEQSDTDSCGSSGTDTEADGDDARVVGAPRPESVSDESLSESTVRILGGTHAAEPITVAPLPWRSNVPLHDKPDAEGWTALHSAASSGHTECVRHLLIAGCDPYVKDRFGWTARSYAVFHGFVHAVCDLLPNPSIDDLLSVAPMYVPPTAGTSGDDHELERGSADIALNDRESSEPEPLTQAHRSLSVVDVHLAAQVAGTPTALPRRDITFGSSPVVAPAAAAAAAAAAAPASSPSASSVGAAGMSPATGLPSAQLLEDKHNRRDSFSGVADAAAARRYQRTSMTRSHTESDLMEPHEKPIGWCTVEFKVQAYTRDDQCLCIIGDCPELGYWNPLKGIMLKPKDDGDLFPSMRDRKAARHHDASETSGSEDHLDTSVLSPKNRKRTKGSLSPTTSRGRQTRSSGFMSRNALASDDSDDDGAEDSVSRASGAKPFGLDSLLTEDNGVGSDEEDEFGVDHTPDSNDLITWSAKIKLPVLRSHLLAPSAATTTSIRTSSPALRSMSLQSTGASLESLDLSASASASTSPPWPPSSSKLRAKSLRYAPIPKKPSSALASQDEGDEGDEQAGSGVEVDGGANASDKDEGEVEVQGQDKSNNNNSNNNSNSNSNKSKHNERARRKSKRKNKQKSDHAEEEKPQPQRDLKVDTHNTAKKKIKATGTWHPGSGQSSSRPHVQGNISYKYIVRSTSRKKVHKWEALPSNRNVTLVMGSHVLVDDGVFGTRSSKSSALSSAGAAASSSCLSPGVSGSGNAFGTTQQHSKIHSLRNGDADTQERWVSEGWLVSESELQICLGHLTVANKRPAIRWFGNEHVDIDHLVIRCGEPSGLGKDTQHHLYPYPNPAPLHPIKFHVSNTDAMHLHFEVYGSAGPPIAVAHALPSAIVPTVEGVATCPLVGRNSSQVLGELAFEFLFITPFKHPLINTALGRTFSKAIRVIGHRGTGANRNAASGLYRRSHIAENTLLSFVAASSMGAQYIEFDVQLTLDRVPIIYHDYVFKSESAPYGVPICNMTLAEFMQTAVSRSRTRSFGSLREITESGLASELGMSRQELLEKGWANCAAGSSHLDATADSAAAMPIRDSITTLQETFLLVPEATGFNIEIKYPYEEAMLEHNYHPIDRNTYIDIILETVFEHALDRPIIFSSFDPSIAKIVSLKQPRYPVFFLTEAGSHNFVDPRRNSLRHAIDFARSAKLLGLVSWAEPLVEAPELITAVKNSGLLLCTYGTNNNDTRAVALQKRYGVDSVIVDHVAHIAEFLQNEQFY